MALRTGFDADIRLTPDTNQAIQRDISVAQKTDNIQLIEFNLDKQERYNVQLPFTISCTEIEQKLIDPNGSIEINNTLDWRTQIKIDDPEYGTTIADVSLNRPFTYRGYRFFQASAITMGSASLMTLELRPEKEGEKPITVNLKRNETAQLPDGTKIAYASFLPDFIMQGGQPSTRSGEYNNPAVVLEVTKPDGENTKNLRLRQQIARQCSDQRSESWLPVAFNELRKIPLSARFINQVRSFQRCLYRLVCWRFRAYRGLNFCVFYFAQTNLGDD